MDYYQIDPDTLTPDATHPCDRRSITAAAKLGLLAVARYDLAPGEELASTYHYHEDREEVFIVITGPLWIETPTTEFTVPAGQTFVVKPDSPIRPFNPHDAEESIRVYGVGAPKYDIGRPYTPDDQHEDTSNRPGQ